MIGPSCKQSMILDHQQDDEDELGVDVMDSSEIIDDVQSEFPSSAAAAALAQLQSE